MKAPAHARLRILLLHHTNALTIVALGFFSFWYVRLRRGIQDTPCNALLAQKILRTAPREISDGRITKLNLMRNAIDDALLLELVAEMPSSLLAGLQVLELSHNRIGDTGLAALLHELTSTKAPLLQKLWLDSNVITHDGAEHIRSWLASNFNIATLGLSDNHLCDAGAVAICAALQSNSSLTELRLKGNSISDAAADGLMSVLRNSQNTSLRRLFLERNAFSEVVQAQLRDAVPVQLRLDMQQQFPIGPALLIYVCSPETNKLPQAQNEVAQLMKLVRNTHSSLAGTARTLQLQLNNTPPRWFLFCGHADEDWEAASVWSWSSSMVVHRTGLAWSFGRQACPWSFAGKQRYWI
ncbi:hypothetical protein EMIHUDRAFT_227679 [Emiliania huxleyi CCMP1516]|uniref:Uncharacterized protein n=2 Tax=Emiliania huxleyi TaxID=2903 RepID=A0A0D3KHC7_EMIH1|nr:hypothetical protein EMIHUDRAFT_227679 [Emiliania huxleyi CCMP1516]EOD35162.1 hypothetical protein EMIHUDRAFT_227679 [Emiliania huxleyi CCMP1516]|eukprot:XP_005787591.1 hypothetical protein EMIHUDRAFT_227679 [Emiliania huxleyi CCMP1516]